MKIAVNYGEFDDLPILDKSRELENYLGEEICVESLKSEPFLLTVTQDMKKRASSSSCFFLCAGLDPAGSRKKRNIRFGWAN